MPPRLVAPGAFCAASSCRAFSSTTARSVPPPRQRDPLSSYVSPYSSSSSSDLLTVGSSRNKNQNYKNDFSNRSSGTTRSTSAAGQSALRMVEKWSPYNSKAQSMLKAQMENVESLRNIKNSNDYLKQMPRRWAPGDVYSPHDMSPVEMQKWRKRSPRKADVVDALGLRPLDMYKNFSLIQEFTSSSGQITHSSGTSLRPVNQRKIAKMIRRVQGMGLYPTIHDHPEMIRDSFFPPRR